MGVVPGPRTSPTIKVSAHSHQRALRAWQVNLNAVQVAVLLGGVLGSLACAFYLGFFSGQKVGLEMALSNNLSAAMRMPIGSVSELEDDSFHGGNHLGEISDVYAKLREVEVPEPNDLVLESEVPSVRASIGVAGVGSSADQATEPRVGDTAIDRGEIGRSRSARTGLDERGLGADSMRTGELSPEHDSGLTLGQLAQGEADKAIADRDSTNVVGGNQLPSSEVGGLDPQRQGGARESVSIAASRLTSEEASVVDRVQRQAVTSLSSRVAPELGKPVAEAGSVQPKESARMSATSSVSRNEPLRNEPSRSEPNSRSEAPGSGLIKDRLPKGWFAQVGAPDNRAEAERLGRSLKSSGFPVVIEQAKVRGQEYYRILVGPEDTRQQAERLMGQLKREPAVKADPFIRMVR